MEQAPSSRPRAQHERFQALPLHSKTERHPAQLAQPYESMSLNHLFCYSATLLLCYLILPCLGLFRAYCIPISAA